MHLKMSSAKWRSFCLSHNVLIIELCHQCSCAVPCYSIQTDTMISLPDITLYWIQQCGDLMLNIYQNLNTPKHSFRSSSWASYGVSILKENWFGYDGTALNHVESVIQVAISLTSFHHFSNAMKIFCFHPYSIKVIATMFCTCPDSLAVMAYSVMACAKYCCDLMTRNWITEKKKNFPSNLNYEWKIVSEMGLGGVSLSFCELSLIFSWNLCTAEIVILMRISSWNFVRVPKTMLWTHVQSFSLKFSP